MKLENLLIDPVFRDGIPIKNLSEIEKIKAIQQGLTDAGYPTAVDGQMGEQTYGNWCQFKKDTYQQFPDVIGVGSIKLLMEKVLKQPPVNFKEGIYYELTPLRKCYLSLIAWCEGTDTALDEKPTGYDILYGYKRFNNFSTHPKSLVSAGGITSSAAGRYQIMNYTWDEIQRALHLPSFKPIHQDQAALWLLHVKRKALGFVDKDDLWNFCQICSWEWASIPPYRYPGQGSKNFKGMKEALESLKKVYGVN